MSKEQGFAGKAANTVFHANAIKNIIRAFMQGGWASAGLQALKYYWPQILTVALILILLPVIIVTCFPMMMFGFEGSTDPQITEMTAQAGVVEGYFDNYISYFEERANEINTEIIPYINSGYSFVQTGELMSRNWFIAIFSVSVGNDLREVTEQHIKDFVDSCVIYEVSEANNTETESFPAQVTVKWLSAEETMDYLNYSESDKNWATLIFNTLESGEVNEYNSIYSD